MDEIKAETSLREVAMITKKKLSTLKLNEGKFKLKVNKALYSFSTTEKRTNYINKHFKDIPYVIIN
jgi:hypothetical protein